MRRERELMADERVLHCLGGASEDYSASLLHVVKQSRQRWYMAPGLVGIGEDGAEVARIGARNVVPGTRGTRRPVSHAPSAARTPAK